MVDLINVEEHIERIRTATDALKVLLDDSHPGTATWMQAFCREAEYLGQLLDVVRGTATTTDASTTAAPSKPPPSVRSSPTSPTWPVVEAFSQLMESKLAMRRYKGDRPGWMAKTPMWLWLRMEKELGEAAESLATYLETGLGADALSVAMECADTANLLMMVADRVRGLQHPLQEITPDEILLAEQQAEIERARPKVSGE